MSHQFLFQQQMWLCYGLQLDECGARFHAAFHEICAFSCLQGLHDSMEEVGVTVMVIHLSKLSASVLDIELN
jgi:hypothetical protein